MNTLIRISLLFWLVVMGAFTTKPTASGSNSIIIWGDILVYSNSSGFNEVSWTTLREVNAESFLIQRSEDGKHFQTIGRKTPKGKSSTSVHYMYEDQEGGQGDQYRIIVIDLQGKVTYSRAVKKSEPVTTRQMR